MLNKKVKSKVDIPYYFKKDHTYQLENIYEGGMFLQYKVRGYDRRLSDYFDATLFEILE